MSLQKIISSLLVASFMSFSSCGKNTNPKPVEVQFAGKISNVLNHKLQYVKEVGLSSQAVVDIPITTLDVSFKEKKISLLYPGPNNLENGDLVSTSYIPDSQVSSKEILESYYPNLEDFSKFSCPRKHYSVDGLLTNYRVTKVE